MFPVSKHPQKYWHPAISNHFLNNMERRKFLKNLTLRVIGTIGTTTFGATIFLNEEKTKLYRASLPAFFRNHDPHSSLRIYFTSHPVFDGSRLPALSLGQQRVEAEVIEEAPETRVRLRGIEQGIVKKTDSARYYYLVSPKGEVLISESLPSPYPLTIGRYFHLSELQITLRGRA
jgi:hypothetical protein